MNKLRYKETFQGYLYKQTKNYIFLPIFSIWLSRKAVW